MIEVESADSQKFMLESIKLTMNTGSSYELRQNGTMVYVRNLLPEFKIAIPKRCLNGEHNPNDFT